MPSELPEAVLKIVFDNIAPEISTFFTAFTVLSIIISVVIILHVFENSVCTQNKINESLTKLLSQLQLIYQ